ncbi:hypothetical protein [Methylotuvimicrobium sp. KM1]|uniref:hypothetical protein n=1 Tax=Methylotuvimicrobium sp. KM1 TaxID=3377707 RepID=UPI00384B5253
MAQMTGSRPPIRLSSYAPGSGGTHAQAVSILAPIWGALFRQMPLAKTVEDYEVSMPWYLAKLEAGQNSCDFFRNFNSLI